MKIFFLYLANKRYANIWNNLTAETLMGDVSAYLEGNLDYIIHTLDDDGDIDSVVQSVNTFEPDILGISVPIDTLGIFLNFIYEYLNHKKINPMVVLGNILPESNADFFINHEISKRMSYIISKGPGEHVFRQIVDVVRQKKTLDEVKNIVYWDAVHEKVLINSRQKFDFSHLIYPPCTDTIKAGQVNTVQTSRGCYFNCAYCSQGPHNTWIRLPIDRIKMNIHNLLSKGVNQFEFIDEDFLGGRLRQNYHGTKEIVDYLYEINSDHGIAYRIFTTPSVIYQETENQMLNTNDEMETLLNKMVQSGLKRVYIGIESGSVTQRKRYNRKETIYSIEKSLEILHRYHLEIDCGFIMFDPLVTIQELNENIQFIRKHKLMETYIWPISAISLTNHSPYCKYIMSNFDLQLRIDHHKNNYRYSFWYQEVQQIYTIVQTISAQTAELFYRNKFVIKKYFVTNNPHINFKLFQKISKQNSEIYLDLLDGLMNSPGDLDRVVTTVLSRIEKLVLALENHLDVLNIAPQAYLNIYQNFSRVQRIISGELRSVQDLYKRCQSLTNS